VPFPPPAPAPAAAPAPQAYGGGMLETRSAKSVRGYGVDAVGAGAPAPLAAAAQAAPGFAAAPPPPPPPAGPPQPSAGQLDYATLVLAGPDKPYERRGRLVAGSPADPGAGAFRAAANALHDLPLPGHAVSPRASAGSFDQRYDAAAPADIPSDGTWHTVTVTELPLALRTEYVCVPSVEEAVYATLVLANPTDRALLAGPVEVSVDGDFLVTAALPTLAPGGSRRLGLGQAEGVRVARRAELRESAAGMLNNTTVLDHRVHVELANRLPVPVTVEVRERVPVSSDPDVRIEERAGWAPPGEPSDAYPPSTRVWRVELPAGASTELDGGYEIRIPAGKALVGGNRRS